MVLWISPWKLFRQSVLAGVIFILAFLIFALDITVLGMRGYWFGFVTSWQLDSLLGLDGLAFGILVSIMWYALMVFLLTDLMATLLIASRDLQEGTVIAFGIISIMQIPLVTLFLMYELNPTNQLWLLVACIETGFSDNCSSWLQTHKWLMIIPSSISCALHIVLLGFASHYIRTRTTTSAALLLDDELEYLKAEEKTKEAKKKRKEEKKQAKKEEKERKEQLKKPKPTYIYHSGSSSDEGNGGPNPKPGLVPAYHEMDPELSSSDLEKQPFPAEQQKELGRRRRGSMSSRSSSRRY
ncbi:hypothetical protein JCM5353_002292 [Sporobolomyces roseus]